MNNEIKLNKLIESFISFYEVKINYFNYLNQNFHIMYIQFEGENI